MRRPRPTRPGDRPRLAEKGGIQDLPQIPPHRRHRPGLGAMAGSSRSQIPSARRSWTADGERNTGERVMAKREWGWDVGVKGGEPGVPEVPGGPHGR
jgi:hypothetical protein